MDGYVVVLVILMEFGGVFVVLGEFVVGSVFLWSIDFGILVCIFIGVFVFVGVDIVII